MRREKFVYNAHTLRYERVEESLSTKLIRIFGFICAALTTAFIFTLISHRYFPSPREKSLQTEIEAMRTEYDKVLGDVQLLEKALENIQQRDAYAYRMVFGLDPIDKNIWEGGVGGHDEYGMYRQYKNAGPIITAAKQRIRQLKQQMVIESKSLDTVMNMARAQEEMLASIPSIKPVRSDKLARGVSFLSGFGYRIHPIFKVPKMHQGIDFTAPKGTPIQATGAGKVIKAEYSSSFGNHVIIDHGYGYKTIYGHMSKIDVKVGAKVIRGERLGLVGSTGRSTAPHCHYEVHLRGTPVNPVHYCMDGLSVEEYKDMVNMAEQAGQSLD